MLRWQVGQADATWLGMMAFLTLPRDRRIAYPICTRFAVKKTKSGGAEPPTRLPRAREHTDFQHSGGAATDNSAEVVHMAIERDQAAADLLRVEWMAEIGHSPEDIDRSLRYNRSQSAAEEQDLLDLVRKQLEWERTCDEAMRTCT